jgi:hypothetical protein
LLHIARSQLRQSLSQKPDRAPGKHQDQPEQEYLRRATRQGWRARSEHDRRCQKGRNMEDDVFRRTCWPTRVYHSIILPLRKNGSPFTYSSAASREVVTAIVPRGSSLSSRNAPSSGRVPFSCSSLERLTWAAMPSGAAAMASSKEAYPRTQNTMQYPSWLLISIEEFPSVSTAGPRTPSPSRWSNLGLSHACLPKAQNPLPVVSPGPDAELPDRPQQRVFQFDAIKGLIFAVWVSETLPTNGREVRDDLPSRSLLRFARGR